MTHTPGPWIFLDDEHFAEAAPITILAADDRAIGAVANSRYMSGKPSDEDVANARLIAASPDLVDVARMVISLHEVGKVGSGFTFGDVVMRARDALKKVEG